MSKRSFLAEYSIPNLPVMDTANDYAFSFAAPFVSNHMNDGGLFGYPKPGATEDDAPFVNSIRLLCNFADGFLWKPVVNQASFAIWAGNFVVPPTAANHFIYYKPQTFNEWTAVDMPLPRLVPDTMGVYGSVSMLAMGDFLFSTKGINSVFDGEPVTMRLQVHLTTAIW